MCRYVPSSPVGVVVIDGGRVAARGFLYQYLRTLEAVLIALSDESFYACRVEGDPTSSDVDDQNIVDFDLINHEGEVLLAAQVKSGGIDVRLGLTSALRILVNLVLKVDAKRYELITNVSISTQVTALIAILSRKKSPSERRTALDSLLKASGTRETLSNLSDEHMRRLGLCGVSVDMRDSAELNSALRTAIRSARAVLRRGIGSQSSGLLLTYLQSEVHRRAASSDPIPLVTLGVDLALIC